MLIEGTINHVRYFPDKYKKDSFFLILKIKKQRQIYSITGSYRLVPSNGDFVIAKGELTEGKYGKEIKSRNLKITEPQEREHIISRLESFDILSQAEIEEYAKVGFGIWELIDKRMLDLPIERLDQLQRAFQLWKRTDPKSEAIKAVLAFFASYNVDLDDSIAERIVDTLGFEAGKRIRENSLDLAGLVDPEVLTILKNPLLNLLGEIYFDLKETKSLCLIDDSAESQDYEKLAEINRLRRYKDYYYFTPPENSQWDFYDEGSGFILPPEGYFALENEVAKAVDFLLQVKNPLSPSIEELKEGLSDEQIEALETFNRYNISLVSGYPGTGKSKLIKSIVDLCLHDGMKITILAPTGASVKRIRELTKESVKTIHSWLLQTKEFQDVLVVDESSMIDSYLMYRILTSEFFSKIVFIGDENQLPPIHHGQPFKEMLKTKIPHTKLKKIFRFDQNSIGILQALERILQGRTDGLRELGNGFEIINTNQVEKRLEKIAQSFETFDTQKFRIMGALRKQIKQHTPMLRDIFTTHGETDDRIFAVGDWVFQRKNDTKAKIYNGDLGQIRDIREVEFDKEILVNGSYITLSVKEKHYFVQFDHLDEITELESNNDFSLAYISTVHSSQGAEAGEVVILMDIDSQINTRQLLFTAVSRAKKRCRILGNEEKVYSAISRQEGKRLTNLSKMIQ